MVFSKPNSEFLSLVCVDGLEDRSCHQLCHENHSEAMGCGYSKINISSRRGKLKIKAKVDSEYEDYNGSFSPGKFKKVNGKTPSPETVKRNGAPLNTEESLASRRRIAHKIKPISGPMRPPLNRSESQEYFFKMLDDKIANGKDLECEGELDKTEIANGTDNLKLRSETRSLTLMTSNKMLNEENKRSDLVGDMLEAPSTPSIKSSSPTNHEIDKMIDSDSVSPIHNVSSTPPSPKLYSNDTLSTSLSLSSSPKFMSDKPNSDSDVSDTNPDGTLDIVCQEKNSVSVNSNPVTRQTKLNNFEISNDNGAVLDLTGKVETIMANPLHLSNGQVLS